MDNNNEPKQFTGLTVGLIIAAIVAVAGSFFLSKNLFDDLKFKNKSLDTHQEVQATMTTNLENLDGLQENYSRLEEDGPQPELVLEALPVDTDLPSLAAQMEAMALLSDMKLTNIAITSSQGSGGGNQGTGDGSAGSTQAASVNPTANSPQQVNFRATVNGKYKNLIELLKKIRTSVRPMEVTSLDLQAGGESSVEVDIGFVTYYQPPAQLYYEKEIQ